LNSVTLVLPQDSEMSYVTYMFTLYNSPLQYLKAQTQFYSDVLHISMLQVRMDSAKPMLQALALGGGGLGLGREAPAFVAVVYGIAAVSSAITQLTLCATLRQ
jgi:hypothetical protein